MAKGILPAFALDDMSGAQHAFPKADRTVICFVKEDCPTCNLVMPLLEAANSSAEAVVPVSYTHLTLPTIYSV